MAKELTWRKEMRAIGDNPEYGIERMQAIIKELRSRDRPDLGYIESKLVVVHEFIHDIQLAEERAKLRRVI
jgi:hypothetical protein